MNQTEKVAKWCNEYYGTIPWDDMTDSQWFNPTEDLKHLTPMETTP